MCMVTRIAQMAVSSQVLAATKTELAEASVNVAALEAAANASGSAADEVAVPRSTTTLLVKNLPYSCTEDALHDVFVKYGGTLRLVLPSTRSLAIAELPSKQVCHAQSDNQRAVSAAMCRRKMRAFSSHACLTCPSACMNRHSAASIGRAL
jgi:RNA recognition motif. (a.k.a. RRM, RBD, or RNP domain)